MQFIPTVTVPGHGTAATGKPHLRPLAIQVAWVILEVLVTQAAKAILAWALPLLKRITA